MKLKTSLQLSAVFPIVFAMTMALVLRFWLRTRAGMDVVDVPFMAGIGVIGLGMAGIILYYSRDILLKIHVLNQWIEGVLKGDLDQNIDVGSADDEVSNLSRALGKMLLELKTAYRDIQEKSHYHQKDAEAQRKGMQASQLATRHLMKALDKIKATHADELQQERLHVLEMALCGAAHDFSEAIMPVSATCEMLQADPGIMNDSGRLKETFAIFQESAAQCRRLARDLAGYTYAAKEDAGPADCVSVIEQAVAVVKPVCDRRKRTAGAAVDIRVQTDILPPLSVAETDLQDALVHLLRNAIDAMPGGGTVFIGAHAENTSIIIEVRDTGEGMPPEISQRCIEPYYSTRTGTGRGMGLAIVSNLARRHGGHLSIESKPKAGTRVVLKLPACAGAQRKQSTPSGGAATAAAQPGRILVVDDQPMVRSIISKALALKKHQVDTAADGHTALEMLRQARYDAVILDRSMPEMSGDDLAAAIRKENSAIPVLMLTGYGDIMLKEKEIPDNIDVVLPKTASVETLLAALHRSLTERNEGAAADGSATRNHDNNTEFPTVDRL